MTTNEQIAKAMGWDYLAYGDCLRMHRLSNIFNLKTFVMPEDWQPIKALQQRMVADGWSVKISHEINGVHCEAEKFAFDVQCVNAPKFISHYGGLQKTEPAAIVSLFKKVYGIEVEHE
jgi:hypothetical protein